MLLLPVSDLNAYAVLKQQRLLLTVPALEALIGRLGGATGTPEPVEEPIEEEQAAAEEEPVEEEQAAAPAEEPAEEEQAAAPAEEPAEEQVDAQ